MPLTMRPATPADVPDLAAIYFSAFHDNPVAMACFPASSPACRDHIAASFTEEMADPRAHWLVVTDPDAPESPDQPIACAKWVRPAAAAAVAAGEPNVHPPPAIDAWPKEGDPAFADRFFGGINRRHAEIMADVPHYYLELIVCRTEHQGKGAASPLLRWGCERADEDGLLAFLEAVPAARPVYERYGFRALDRLEVAAPGGGVVTQVFMLREGRAADDYGRVVAGLGKSE